MAENQASQLTIKSWYFEASEDIMTKFKSQALHIIKSNIIKPVGVATLPPSFFPPENCHFRSENKIFYTFLHTTVVAKTCKIC